MTALFPVDHSSLCNSFRTNQREDLAVAQTKIKLIWAQTT